MEIKKSAKKIIIKEGKIILSIEALGLFTLFVIRNLVGLVFGGIFFDPSTEIYTEVISKVGYFVMIWGYPLSIVMRGIVRGFRH